MSFLEFVNLCSDEETEVENEKEVRAAFTTNFLQEESSFIAPNYHMEFEYTIQRGFEECRSLLGNPNSCWITDQRHIYANHNQYTYQHTLPGDQHTLPCSTPICRQFWKAGDFEAELPIGQLSQNRQNRLRVHPKFLHSNATSHKWAFGAIAELLDNAIDEVQNGATFVAVDKITNPRDGNPALLIHDDGGGMDPESLRQCMSFGFSIKQSDSSIGQYGNGFKTSTMRLGADVIVFSRCMGKRNITQSVGLLSYTFLRQMGYEDIIVPMVDYEVDPVTGGHKQLLRYGQKQFCSNLSTLLQWSPFATEADLLNQFNVLGDHGTKVIVFNLWFNDDGDMELDFDTLPEDILISGSLKVERTKSNIKMLSQNHIAKRLHYSLRVYSSVLYLHLPETFSIILRGQVVEPHHIVNDLKFVECIKYKPQIEGSIEPTIITTIGFLKDAPHVHYHGFNVYHKNRLILPFWPVIDSANGKCKGVAGVLEVNIIRPTHNKQDFEKSILYQRLESRLKDMAIEYWNYHCQLVGYSNRRTLPSTATLPQLPDGFQTVNLSPQQLRSPSDLRSFSVNTSTIEVSRASTPSAHLQLQEGNLHHSAGRQVLNSLNAQTCSTPGQSTAISQTELPRKRRHGNIDATRSLKKASADGEITSGLKSNQKDEIEHRVEGKETQKLITMVRENKKLQTQCLEHEKEQKQLLAKVQTLRNELLLVELCCESLQAELNLLNETKVEKQCSPSVSPYILNQV